MKVKEFLSDARIYKNTNCIENPIVSIIMPTYCRGESGLLERAIKTVIQQTFREWELIIVDDGSVDSTRDIVERYMNLDNRIIYIRNEINSGIPALRVNQGIMEARGKYIAYQFDDDQWYDDMLETMYYSIKDKKKLSLVYAKCEVVNIISSEEGIVGAPYNNKTIQLTNYIPNNTVLYSRDIPYIYGGLECHIGCLRLNDWDCWRRWSQYIDIFFVNKIVSKVEICNKDAVGMIYNDNREVFELLLESDRENKLLLNNIGDSEVDNTDFIHDYELKYKFLKETFLPWISTRILRAT